MENIPSGINSSNSPQMGEGLSSCVGEDLPQEPPFQENSVYQAGVFVKDLVAHVVLAPVASLFFGILRGGAVGFQEGYHATVGPNWMGDKGLVTGLFGGVVGVVPGLVGGALCGIATGFRCKFLEDGWTALSKGYERFEGENLCQKLGKAKEVFQEEISKATAERSRQSISNVEQYVGMGVGFLLGSVAACFRPLCREPDVLREPPDVEGSRAQFFPRETFQQSVLGQVIYDKIKSQLPAIYQKLKNEQPLTENEMSHLCVSIGYKLRREKIPLDAMEEKAIWTNSRLTEFRGPLLARKAETGMRLKDLGVDLSDNEKAFFIREKCLSHPGVKIPTSEYLMYVHDEEKSSKQQEHTFDTDKWENTSRTSSMSSDEDSKTSTLNRQTTLKWIPLMIFGTDEEQSGRLRTNSDDSTSTRTVSSTPSHVSTTSSHRDNDVGSVRSDIIADDSSNDAEVFHSTRTISTGGDSIYYDAVDYTSTGIEPPTPLLMSTTQAKSVFFTETNDRIAQLENWDQNKDVDQEYKKVQLQVELVGIAKALDKAWEKKLASWQEILDLGSLLTRKMSYLGGAVGEDTHKLVKAHIENLRKKIFASWGRTDPSKR